MLLTRWRFSLFFLAALGLLLSSCAPEQPVMKRLGPSGIQREPTSIVLAYRTPKPTVTSTVGPTPTLTSTPNYDPDYYYEGMVVTMDDVGGTVTLKIGQNFLLELGEDYIWTVNIQPATVVSKNMKITPEVGDQGVFIARKQGKAILLATGEPVCRRIAPACQRPDVLFQITVIVD